jgi:hypothetical protein
MSRRRLSEPTVAVLAGGAVVVMVLFIVAIADTGDLWLVPLTALAMLLIAFAIVADLRRVIGASEDSPAIETPPGRAIVVSTMPMTAAEVRDALGRAAGETHSVMVVCPAGLRGGLLVDETEFARAHRAEAATVAELRGAGLKATGHVGDRNPAHAIEDALALFPAGNVVVVARGVEADVYREHLDLDELRHAGVEVRMRELDGAA